MTSKRRQQFRPWLQILEDRCVPATFTVTNLMDGASVPGSLRKAIDRANQNPDFDTIVFKPGLEGTILLTDGQIQISSSLVLAGPGASKMTVDGDAASRIFQIQDGNPNAVKSVTLKGLTLFNGNAGDGGAVSSVENLKLIKTVFIGNKSSIAGGGVASFGPKTTIQGCTFQNNEATSFGGGVYTTNSKVAVQNSKFTGNHTGIRGGGMYVVNGKLTVSKTLFEGNSAQIGGGVYTYECPKVTIASCTIKSNQADFHGGGVYAGAMHITIQNTKITLNNADSGNGGGVFLQGITRIDRSTITGNTSTGGNGGGISHTTGTLTVTASTISGNRCAGNGGGILTVGLSIRSSTVTGNIAGNDGGGAYVVTNSLIGTRCVISANTALGGDGGGIFQQDSPMKLTASTVSDNRAAGDGGGVALSNIAPNLDSTIRGCTIAANSATRGGGLAGAFTKSGLIQNSTFSGNRAGTEGGGIGLYGCDLWTVQNTTIAFNEANVGGGIWLGTGDMNMDSTIVAENRATGSPDLFSFNPGDDFHVTVSLIGDTSGANIPMPDATTVSLFGKDPLLAPLNFNGGPTPTHALQKGSPAINKGKNAAMSAFDQRGAPFKRQLGPKVDIGAFERP